MKLKRFVFPADAAVSSDDAERLNNKNKELSKFCHAADMISCFYKKFFFLLHYRHFSQTQNLIHFFTHFLFFIFKLYQVLFFFF